MKRRLSARTLFALAAVLVLAANAFVLFKVASNRSGQPEARVVFSQRELAWPLRMHKENSGLALKLVWRTLAPPTEEHRYYYSRHTPAWLNQAKMEALGFKTGDMQRSATGSDDFRRPLPKEVYIVLELNGESYQEALRRAEKALSKATMALKVDPDDKKRQDRQKQAEKRIQRERTRESRLFAVDAGLDATALRARYPDRERFVIAKGQVKTGYRYQHKKKEVYGYISRLSVASISVPLKYRRLLTTDRHKSASVPGSRKTLRYEITTAYGRHLEPWILSVKAADPPAG